MPLYEYGCRSCGTRFEMMRKVEERLSPPPCRACGRTETSLFFSAPGFVGATSPAAAPRCGSEPGSCCGGACMH